MSDAAEIARALATPGRHLSIGRGGFALHFENARLSGYDCDAIKAEGIAAGLPVIDSRAVPFELVMVLAVSGLMVAVNAVPSPRPGAGYVYHHAYRQRRRLCRHLRPRAMASSGRPGESVQLANVTRYGVLARGGAIGSSRAHLARLGGSNDLLGTCVFGRGDHDIGDVRALQHGRTIGGGHGTRIRKSARP